jgi:hypothetical protein
MTMIKRMGMAGVLAGTLALGGGCSHFDSMRGGNQQTWTMHATDKLPAGQGKVQVATAKDGNHDVKVEIKNMAPPDRLYEGSSAFVVWLKAENGDFQNVGALKVDKDFKGELETKTPFSNFDVLVTAESSAAATTPSTNTIMNAKVQVAT